MNFTHKSYFKCTYLISCTCMEVSQSCNCLCLPPSPMSEYFAIPLLSLCADYHTVLQHGRRKTYWYHDLHWGSTVLWKSISWEGLGCLTDVHFEVHALANCAGDAPCHAAVGATCQAAFGLGNNGWLVHMGMYIESERAELLGFAGAI